MSKLQIWGLVLLTFLGIFYFLCVKTPSQPDTILIVHRPPYGTSDVHEKTQAMITKVCEMKIEAARNGTSTEPADAMEARYNRLKTYLSEDITTITSPKEIQFLRDLMGTFIVGFSRIAHSDDGESPIELFGMKDGKIIWQVKVYEDIFLWGNAHKKTNAYDILMKRHPPKTPATTNDKTTK